VRLQLIHASLEKKETKDEIDGTEYTIDLRTNTSIRPGPE